MERNTTLVVGATGALGFEVCRRLRAGGAAVRALVRRGAAGEARLVSLGVEIVRGDLKDAASLAAAASGAERVITAATAMASRRAGDSLRAVDLDGHLSLVRAAIACGVRHFVYTSLSSEANPRAVLVRYKRRVERAVRESGMEWTVLQPAAFMETCFGRAAGWDLEAGRIRIVGPGTARFNPVSLHDVAEIAASTARRPDAARRVIPIGGPDVVCALDAVRVFEEVAGRSFTIKHVPVAVVNIAGALIRPFHPAMSSQLALAAGRTIDDVIEMPLVLAEFPVALTPLREFAARRLGLDEKPSSEDISIEPQTPP